MKVVCEMIICLVIHRCRKLFYGDGGLYADDDVSKIDHMKKKIDPLTNYDGDDGDSGRNFCGNGVNEPVKRTMNIADGDDCHDDVIGNDVNGNRSLMSYCLYLENERENESESENECETFHVYYASRTKNAMNHGHYGA